MKIFVYIILEGMISGVIYDLFRIFRRSFKHRNIFVQLEDLLYWFIILLILFYSLLKINYLELRMFDLVGFCLGMLLYFQSISRIFVPVMVKLMIFIKKCINFFIKILSIPIKLVVKLIMYPVEFIKKILKKIFARIKCNLPKIGGKANEIQSEEEQTSV